MSGNNNLPVRDPKEWVTGDEAPTDKQKGFLAKLASDKGADVDLENINKSEASQKIDQLKNQENTPGGGSQGSTSETIQDPESWSTGGESATGRQAGYIKAMASRAGEQVNVDGLSKTDASEKIEELKEKTGM